MKRLLSLIPGLALSVLTFSCQPDIEAPALNSADLDLRKYVAFGDHVTAGFVNGGLSFQSQQFAYPAILAGQMAKTGAPANFEQPYFSGEGTPMMRLTLAPDGTPIINNAEAFLQLNYAGCVGTPGLNKPYNGNLNSLQNLGVPAVKIKQLNTQGLGNSANANSPGFNPYFERLLAPGDNRSYAEVAAAANPSFFTVWFGMSDIISYAMTGGTCGTLPSKTEYGTALSAFLDILTNRTAPEIAQRKGVILNLPSYDDLPFAKTSEILSIQEGLRKKTGNNSLKIWVKLPKNVTVPSLGDTVYSAEEKEFLTPKGIATVGVQNHGLSPQDPLLNDEVSDRNEVKNLTNALNDYNKRINSLVEEPNYANMVVIADMKSLFGTLRNGVIFNGVKYDLSPVKGGVFSLDNFSLTPRGQAIVANKIIQAMNQEVLPKSAQFSGFGTHIPEVNVNDYPLLSF